MATAKKQNNFTQFVLIFAVVYLGSQLLLRTFFPQQFGGTPQAPGVYVRVQAGGVRQGNNQILLIDNKTQKDIALPSRCPMPPVDVFLVTDPSVASGALQPKTTTETATPCEALTSVPAGQTATYSLQAWKYSLFNDVGTYELRLASSKPAATTSGAVLHTQTGAIATTSTPTVRFRVTAPGSFTQLFRVIISKPFLNFLIFAASWLPDHSLGLAIILLTVLVKLVLFIPTQKALEGQKEMQVLQPKVEALKKKYPNDPQKLQEETMKLWKEHKVNPFQACLPTLIQFPVLIGLFYTVRDGSNLALSRHLIYSFYQHLNWTFGTDFLGLNLLKPNIWILPVLLVALQFGQMKLAFSINERKKRKQDVIDIPSPRELEQEIKDAPKDPVTAQKLQQQMMLYGLPLMIGIFALRVPSAVGIYWGVSTLFAIGQQLVVNRKSIK